jgi:A/G-specific adenine glycosylase
MAAFQHVFSHFRLHIEPWLLQLGHKAAEPLPDQQWLALSELETAALPAPVKKLLIGLL